VADTICGGAFASSRYVRWFSAITLYGITTTVGNLDRDQRRPPHASTGPSQEECRHSWQLDSASPLRQSGHNSTSAVPLLENATTVLRDTKSIGPIFVLQRINTKTVTDFTDRSPCHLEDTTDRSQFNFRVWGITRNIKLGEWGRIWGRMVEFRNWPLRTITHGRGNPASFPSSLPNRW
jgi:hypothetical protein